MRHYTLLILLSLCSLAAMAEKALFVPYTSGNTIALPLSSIGQITFVGDGSTMQISCTDGTVLSAAQNEISACYYAEQPTTVTVAYDGDKATVVNPFLLNGMKAKVSGANVTLTNTDVATERTIVLSGSTTDGSFVYNGEYKTTIQLNGVSITSTKGAAVDIECGKRIAVELKKGTVNTFADCADGKQKAAFYCKGHLEFDKTGTLNVTGNTKHAISAAEYIQFKKSDGFVNVLGAVSDGIHCKQYYLGNGYTITMANLGGDGIQVEKCGDTDYDEDYPDGTMLIQGGKYDITVSGADAACLQADSTITITNGKSVPVLNLTVEGNGGKAIKGSGTGNSYVGEGGEVNITVKSTASVAHGISTNDNLIINGGTYTIKSASPGVVQNNDTYTAKGITSDGSVTLTGGTINIAMTGAGGKGIKADKEFVMGKKDEAVGPVLTVSTTGAKLSTSNSATMAKSTQSSGDEILAGWPGGGGGFPWNPGGGNQSNGLTASAKAIKATGAITIYGGTTVVTTTTDGAEGLESKTSISINGGTHYFKCYDDCINCSGIINFAGGNTVCYSYGNDAVDSNYGRSGAITVSGGNIFAYTTKGSPEEGLDCDNNSYIKVTGGIAVSAGGSQGGGGMGGSSSSIGSASQGYYLGSSPSSYASSRYYTLCSTTGEAICTFMFEANCSNSLSLLTAPNLGKGSFTVKYGTTKPTAYTTAVCNAAGTEVFFVNPTVTTTGTTSTLTSK